MLRQVNNDKKDNNKGVMQQKINTYLEHAEVVKFISYLDDVFSKAPKLPKPFTNVLVSIAPWLAGVGGVLGIIGSLQSISYGFGSMSQYAELFSQFARIPRWYFTFVGVIQLLSSALLIMAFSPLKDKKYYGWLLLFWNMLLMTIQNLVGLAVGLGGAVGVLLSILIGLYLLFQMKPEYSTKKAS